MVKTLDFITDHNVLLSYIIMSDIRQSATIFHRKDMLNNQTKTFLRNITL